MEIVRCDIIQSITKTNGRDKMDYLEKNSYYMNEITGSVASGEEWMDDFKRSFTNGDIEDGDGDRILDIGLAWDAWGSHSLYEVVKDVKGDWVEE